MLRSENIFLASLDSCTWMFKEWVYAYNVSNKMSRVGSFNEMWRSLSHNKVTDTPIHIIEPWHVISNNVEF